MERKLTRKKLFSTGSSGAVDIEINLLTMSLHSLLKLIAFVLSWCRT